MQKNLLNPEHRAEIRNRFAKLNANASAQWGKMNAGEMSLHCQYPLEVALAQKALNRGLMGLLFGKMIKKQLLADKALPKNSPTVPQWRTAGSQSDYNQNSSRLLSLIDQFGQEDPAVLNQRIHPVFGPMTSQEWGVLNYKHLDHHLRQFGV